MIGCAKIIAMGATFLFMLFPLHLCAEDVSGQGVATVTLDVPYPTMIQRESMQFTVWLRNDSGSDMPYYPSAYDGSGKQLFIKVDRGAADYEERFRRNAPKSEVQFRNIQEHGKWDVVRQEATAVLKPGESAVLCRGFDLEYGHFQIDAGNPRGIQAQVLVGPGKWVSSQVMPIKILPPSADTDFANFPVVFRGSIMVNAKAGKSQDTFITRGTVEGNEYLFSAGHYRICEVPKGAAPKFDLDAATGLFVITLDGATNPPVLFNYWKLSVLKEQPKPLTTNAVLAVTPAQVSTNIAHLTNAVVLQVSSPSVSTVSNPSPAIVSDHNTAVATPIASRSNHGLGWLVVAVLVLCAAWLGRRVLAR